MDIMDLLMGGGDPMQAQKRQAAMLAGKQDFQQMGQQANDQANSLNLLNFAAQNSNNSPLATAVGGMQKIQQAQYTPTKLDKGVYIPATGEYQESPGAADEKEADRQTRMLAAAGAAQARTDAAQSQADARQYAAEQSSQARILAATIAGQGRADRNANKADADATKEQDKRDKMFQIQEGKLTTSATRVNAPALIGSSTELVNRLQPYVDKGQIDSIPGLTRTDRLMAHAPLPFDWTQSGQDGEGAQNMAMVKSAILDQLKTQVGLGGTNRARDEQLVETLSGSQAGSRDFINAYNNAIHPRLEMQRRSLLNNTVGWTPEQWQQHIDAGGIDYRTPIPRINTDKVPSQNPRTPMGPARAATPGVMHFDAQGNPVQ